MKISSLIYRFNNCYYSSFESLTDEKDEFYLWKNVNCYKSICLQNKYSRKVETKLRPDLFVSKTLRNCIVNCKTVAIVSVKIICVLLFPSVYLFLVDHRYP